MLLANPEPNAEHRLHVDVRLDDDGVVDDVTLTEKILPSDLDEVALLARRTNAVPFVLALRRLSSLPRDETCAGTFFSGS